MDERVDMIFTHCIKEENRFYKLNTGWRIDFSFFFVMKIDPHGDCIKVKIDFMFNEEKADPTPPFLLVAATGLGFFSPILSCYSNTTHYFSHKIININN